MSVELSGEQVRGKARAAQNLASQLGGVKLAGPVVQAGGGLIGAQAQQAASALAQTWAQRVSNLAADVDAYADALRSSMGALQGVDGDVRGYLGRHHDGHGVRR